MQIDKPDGNDQESLRRAEESPRAAEASPDVVEASRDADEASPDVAEASPGTDEASRDADEATPGVAEASPDVAEVSPDVVDASPDVAEEHVVASFAPLPPEPPQSLLDEAVAGEPLVGEPLVEDEALSGRARVDEPVANEPIARETIAAETRIACEPSEAEDVEPPARRRPLRVPPRSLLGAALIGGATLTALLLGRVAMKRGPKRWYRSLAKPPWTPPERVFGLVWPLLYTLSAASAWRVWRAPPSKKRSAALGMWATQMATNAAWSPLFFGRRRPAAALADLSANLGSAAGYALAARKVDGTAGLLMLPYVAWVTFAGTINASVVRHNA